jgi:CheY-like chemotaxis protein
VTALAARPVDVVVTDLRMPGALDGLGLLREVRAGATRPPRSSW